MIVVTRLGADAFGVDARYTIVAAPGPTQRQSVMSVVVVFSPLDRSMELRASNKTKA
jgi:hypothetical protein